jgi:hypothetical protein
MEEHEILTDLEKANSIRSKIKSIQYNKYSIELDIISENATSNPSTSLIEEYQNQLNNLIARENALKSELDKLA